MQRSESSSQRETCCLICDLRIGIIVLAIMGMVRENLFYPFYLSPFRGSMEHRSMQRAYFLVTSCFWQTFQILKTVDFCKKEFTVP